MEGQLKGRCFHRPHFARAAGIILGFCVAGGASAQWPTSYLTPRILSTGADVRAGNILATPDGGVIACFDTYDGDVRKLALSKFNASGSTVISGTSFQTGNKGVKLQVLPPDRPARLCSVVTSYARGSVDTDGITYVYQRYELNGYWSLASFPARMTFEAAIGNTDGSNHIAAYNPWDGLINVRKNDGSSQPEIALNGERAHDFFIAETRPGQSLVAFTKHGPQPETPGQIWLFPFYGLYSPPTNGTPVRAQNQGEEWQSKARIVDLGNNRNMVTWIGTLNNRNRLYAKVVNDLGGEISAARMVLQDVADYVTTGSSLGVPVIAGVQRVTVGSTTVDTLFGGLIDAQNGLALTLPQVNAPGVKVKDLRQEANGDFTLAYSIPENGTNLLKVRRISVATIGTLWETTVADLGVASDDVIERSPNVFISGGASGVLYIMSRNDHPGSNMSTIALARLQADGQMGIDPLVAPTNLNATHVGLGNIGLTWDDNTASETNYVVGRSLTDFSGVEILDMLPANMTSYTDTSAAGSTTYRYYVAAYQSHTGNYLVSNEKVFTTPGVLIE